MEKNVVFSQSLSLSFNFAIFMDFPDLKMIINPPFPFLNRSIQCVEHVLLCIGDPSVAEKHQDAQRRPILTIGGYRMQVEDLPNAMSDRERWKKLGKET